MPSSSGRSHKEFTASGYVPEPCGYIQVPAPPSDWSVVIDGHTITPRVIQKTLRRCHDAGVDMWYLAEKLHIGSGAIERFLVREKTIPETIAKRFYEVFSSSESLPKAPKSQAGKMIDWNVPIEPDEKPNPWRRPQGSPDFDGNGLGLAVAQKRREAQLSLAVVARRVKCSAAFISSVEQGGMNYKSLRCLVLYRLCDILGIDIRQYELKPRVDFNLFRKIVRANLQEINMTLVQLAKVADVPYNWVVRYLSEGHNPDGASYLEGNISQIMTTLNLNVNEILLTKKEVANVENQHREVS